jgi:hypothetical protein
MEEEEEKKKKKKKFFYHSGCIATVRLADTHCLGSVTATTLD